MSGILVPACASAAVDFERGTLAHVARLARLRLDEPDLARLERDVAAILDLFASLPDVEAPQHAPPPAALRHDEPAPFEDRALLLANVPALEGDRIKLARRPLP